ncbi:MAG: hypothetical protein JSR58_00845 [Verrucomicrobia bacterium]|nr:hypothetical protein [Verrucomicrobiota bacterium]
MKLLSRASSLLLFLCSCGYHFTDNDKKVTIEVPYVKGDFEGMLTGQLIRELETNGHYEYTARGGEKILKVSIAGDGSDIIGWRHDRKVKSGKVEHNLIAVENRRTITADVTLVDTLNDKVIWGPIAVVAWADYDYSDVNSLRQLSFFPRPGKRASVFDFSMGQLDSVEGAQDDAITPLYRELARKIVDALASNAVSTED